MRNATLATLVALLLVFGRVDHVSYAQSGAPVSRVPKQVFLIIAIDASGSMDQNDGEKRRFDAAKFLVGALDQGDRVAILTFGSETNVVVGKESPPEIRGPDDKQRVWQAIDGLKQEPVGYTDFQALFRTLDEYLLTNLSPMIETQTLLVVLTDGEDYIWECDPAGGRHNPAVCAQHQRDARPMGERLRDGLAQRYDQPAAGNAFTLLPIALKGSASSYDLGFLSAISRPRLEPGQIPQPEADQLITTFEEQVIGRLLSRVSITGEVTSQLNVFKFRIPRGVRSATFAAPRPRVTTGNLELFHGDPARPFSVPPGGRTSDLATIPNPPDGEWWLRQTNVGNILPRVLLRVDLDVAFTPGVVPMGQAAQFEVDLRDPTTGSSFLGITLPNGSPVWTVDPRARQAPAASPAARRVGHGVEEPIPVTVSKSGISTRFVRNLYILDSLFTRANLDALQDAYALKPGDVIPLSVRILRPPDEQFQVANVYAYVDLGGAPIEVRLQPDPADRDLYRGEADVLPLLGESGTGTLTVRYEADARYGGFAYPREWWRLSDPKKPTLTLDRGWIQVNPLGIVNPDGTVSAFMPPAVDTRRGESAGPYSIGPGQQLGLEVTLQVPTTPDLQVGGVVARVELGGREREIDLAPASTVQPGGATVYRGVVDVLPLFGEVQDAPLRVTYALRDTSYRRIAHAPSWWSQPFPREVTLHLARNILDVEKNLNQRGSAQDQEVVDAGWLRRQNLDTQRPAIGLRCAPCEPGAVMTAVGSLGNWTRPDGRPLDAPAMPVQVTTPLRAGDPVLAVPLDLERLQATLGGQMTEIAEGKLTFDAQIATPGDSDVRYHGQAPFRYRVDNRTELRHLWEEGRGLLLAGGATGAIAHYVGADARLPWTAGSAGLAIPLSILAVYLYTNGRRWLAWGPPALLGGGLVWLGIGALLRLVFPDFGSRPLGRDIESGSDEGQAQEHSTSWHRGAVRVSNDPLERADVSIDALPPYVYAEIVSAGGLIRVRGKRGTQIVAADGRPRPDAYMQEDERYFLEPGSAPRGPGAAGGVSTLLVGVVAVSVFGLAAYLWSRGDGLPIWGGVAAAGVVLVIGVGLRRLLRRPAPPPVPLDDRIDELYGEPDAGQAAYDAGYQTAGVPANAWIRLVPKQAAVEDEPSYNDPSYAAGAYPDEY